MRSEKRTQSDPLAPTVRALPDTIPELASVAWFHRPRAQRSSQRGNALGLRLGRPLPGRMVSDVPSLTEVLEPIQVRGETSPTV